MPITWPVREVLGVRALWQLGWGGVCWESRSHLTSHELKLEFYVLVLGGEQIVSSTPGLSGSLSGWPGALPVFWCCLGPCRARMSPHVPLSIRPSCY